MTSKDFFQKNFNKFHIAGCVLFIILAVLYWWVSGKNQPQIYKNNLGLVILWGLVVGWISGDFISNARNKTDN